MRLSLLNILRGIFTEDFLTRLIYWVFFALALAILPVVISYIIIILQHPKCSAFDAWSESISKGELMIISSALLGLNLGDLNREAPSRSFKMFHFFLVGISVILAMLTIAIYVFVSTSNKLPSHEIIANLSGAMLFSTIIICIISLLIE